jgi:hypothetical protein
MAPLAPLKEPLVILCAALLLIVAGCGPGDLSLRVSTDRQVSRVNVNVQYARGDDVSETTERVALDGNGVGVLDLMDDVSSVYVSMSMSQPRDPSRSVLQRPGNTKFELLSGEEVIDASTGMLPSVRLREE